MVGFRAVKKDSILGIPLKLLSHRKHKAAQVLYCMIYGALTLILVLLLMLGGINIYDALIHAYGAVGPMGSISHYSGFSKMVLSICMLAGRLEIFPLDDTVQPIRMAQAGVKGPCKVHLLLKDSTA